MVVAAPTHLSGAREGRMGRVRVLRVHSERLCDISDREAIREGFESRPHFLQAFHKINPKAPMDVSVWRVEFEVVGSDREAR